MIAYVVKKASDEDGDDSSTSATNSSVEGRKANFTVDDLEELILENLFYYSMRFQTEDATSDLSAWFCQTALVNHRNADLFIAFESRAAQVRRTVLYEYVSKCVRAYLYACE